MEEAYHEMILDALKEYEIVIVNDLNRATAAMGECGFYLRPSLINVPMTVLSTYAGAAGKRLIIGSNGNMPEPMAHRCYTVALGKLTPNDYRHICSALFGEDRIGNLDLEKVHRFAPNLNGHQLRGACSWFQATEITTDRFIDYLRSMKLSSNVELGEVTEVDLHDLKGVDDVIRSLEANIVIPLEHTELARELELQPKRGVLLAGPTGTGKTTIGRALAHRLRGKFFLIDGTFISGTQHFYEMIHRVFHEAKENVPSILFIDDSDVIIRERTGARPLPLPAHDARWSGEQERRPRLRGDDGDGRGQSATSPGPFRSSRALDGDAPTRRGCPTVDPQPVGENAPRLPP